MVMALRLLVIILSSRQLGYIVACSRRAIATSWGRKVGVAASTQRKQLLRELFSYPSQWWDCRPEKVNVRYPDFKHKKAQGAFWLGDGQNPPWVGEKLAALPTGTVEWDLFSWNRRLSRYVKAGQHETTIELFHEMQQKGMSFDRFTFVPVLNACASLQESGYESDVGVGNSLVDMYAKCGSMEDACRVFNKLPSHDVVCWNALLGGYAMQGVGRKLLNFLKWMCEEGVQPDDITFICLLSACSHAGLVVVGLCCYASMSTIHKISAKLECYICLVDLLGHAGHLQEAENRIKAMPYNPNVAVWMALLSACRIHGNVEMAECVVKQVLELEPENAAGYVLLS